MFESAERLRAGQLDATAAHRDAIAALRARTAEIAEDAGHPANEATLRRVTTTLAALAAAGGFDPDPPGALTADRDPPGFAGVGIIAPPGSHAPPADPPSKSTRSSAPNPHDPHDAQRARDELE